MRQRRKWFRNRYVTYTDAKRARIVWNLVGGDKCFIQRGGQITFGEHLAGAPDVDFATWFPANWLHRLIGDPGRRSIFEVVGPIIAFLVFFGAIRVLPDSWNLAMPVIVALLLTLAAVQFAFRDFAPEGIVLRLVVGLIAGVVWAVAGGTFSPMTAAGAVWVFTLGNLIATAILGYDRYVFRGDLQGVGGPMSEMEALRLLEVAANERVNRRGLGSTSQHH